MENSEEYIVYSVKETARGAEIVYRNKELKEELIFAMVPDDSGLNRAWLDYWCMRLNRAFTDGWFGAKGLSVRHDRSYYEELDRLFKRMTKS